MSDDEAPTLHPAGAEVWEKTQRLDDDTMHLTSWSIMDPEVPYVMIPVDRMRMLLLAAGYERMGIADGTGTTWAEQTGGA